MPLCYTYVSNSEKRLFETRMSFDVVSLICVFED